MVFRYATANGLRSGRNSFTPCVYSPPWPLNNLAAAIAAVVDGGVIKIMPGSTRARLSISNNKRMRLVAPIGGVNIGVRY